MHRNNRIAEKRLEQLTSKTWVLKNKALSVQIYQPENHRWHHPRSGEWLQISQFLGQQHRTRHQITKALAWKASNKMSSVWKTALSRTFKVRLLSATVESVLLYGCESWTLTQKLEKMLDGCYTQLLRCTLNISWKDLVTNKELYVNIPKISQKIWKWRLNLVGHCYWHKEEAAAQLILWRPKHGKKSWGQPAQYFVGTLAWDSGIKLENLGASMMDRTVWRGIIAPVSNPPWLTDWSPKKESFSMIYQKTIEKLERTSFICTISIIFAL